MKLEKSMIIFKTEASQCNINVGVGEDEKAISNDNLRQT
jgi:hypothetical protein